MATVKNEDKEISVEVATGTDENGAPTSDKWTFANADQAEKHLPQFTDTKQPAARRISKGDESALRDRANEFRKQAES